MLSRWNPFEEIDRLFGRSNDDQMFAPAVDIFEQDDSIILNAELPGLRPEEVQIDIDNNVLTLKGERKFESSEDTQGGYHRIERRYGGFVRSFVMPSNVSADAIEANMENGVLTVKVPKRRDNQARKISIGSKATASSEKLPEQKPLQQQKIDQKQQPNIRH